jgi:hypothetical protein
MRWSALVSAVTVFAVVAGGTLVWLIERNVPGSNLHHWGDSLWWAVTTLTTVGYGEHYPVTVLGRLVAVAIMISGIGIIGAVAAVVAFGFAGRLAQRLEDAVSHVEHQVEHVEHEMESVSERVGARRGLFGGPRGGLRELVIGVADADTASSLTWLLARLGWHPEAGDGGVGWRDGDLLLRIAVRPWDTPFGVQGRLTLAAGSPDRLARIGREAARHGFHRLFPKEPVVVDDQPGASVAGVIARAAVGAVGAVGAAIPGVASSSGQDGVPANSDGSRRPGMQRGKDGGQGRNGSHGADGADGKPIVLRTQAGFEVVLVTS